MALSPHDLDAIRALSAGYVHYLDNHDADAAAALFSTNGVWDGSTAGLDVRRGREAIRRGFERGSDAPSYFHLSGNQLVRAASPDEASGTEHIIAIHFTPDGGMHLSLSRLSDHYVRTSEGWRFELRRLESIGRARLEPEGGRE